MANDYVSPAAATGEVATVPWYREVIPQSWRALVFAGLGWMFDVYDTFALSLTITEWAVLGPRARHWGRIRGERSIAAKGAP